MKKTILIAIVYLVGSLTQLKAQGAHEFWNGLKAYCGKAFEGKVLIAPAGDTNFAGKKLVMHVRSCQENEIRIPFFVGDDRSRTWVLSMHDSLMQLKHDHRHKDGSEDRVTQYGGRSTNQGSAKQQVFPADQFTATLLPASVNNVWWIDFVPGEHFTYNLIRLGTERRYSIRFDLKQEVPAPAAPWGSKD